MEKTPHICVCDDEAAIADLVGTLLGSVGYRNSVCYTGAQVLDLMARDPFDLVLLDIMMPGIDGFTCCREIRKTSQVPIIFLTAKDEEIDKVVGFELGADDYVVKPFKPRELMARVKARLRRSSGEGPLPGGRGSALLEVCGIVLDEGSYTASLFGEELLLTPKEFAILRCLMQQPGKPVASSELFETVWNEVTTPQSNNTVMVHIRHVRKKLSEIDSSNELIETVWGVGYKLG